MDMFLRSYARIRSQQKRRQRGTTQQPDDRKRPPASLFRGRPAVPQGLPDLVLTNCRLPAEEGLFQISIRDGVIQSLEPSTATANAQQKLDAGGGLLLPGFTDSHVHLLAGAERLSGCDLESVGEPAELERRLRQFAEQHPKRPLLRAFGLNYLEPPLLSPDDARRRLDAIVSDRPLMVFSRDLHTLWVNTRTLEECDLMRPMPPYPRELNTPASREGLVLDSEGLPTGELREPACYFLVEGKMGSRFPRSAEEKLAALRNAVAELNSFGITSVHHMGLAMPEGDLELLLLLLELEEKGQLNLRVESSYSVVADEFMLRDVQDAATVRDRLRGYREGELTSSQLYEFLGERLKSMTKNSRFESLPGHDFILGRHVAPILKWVAKRLGQKAPPLSQVPELVTLEAVKVFIDGVIEKDTALRSDREPRPGIPNFSAQDLEEVVLRADRSGLQVRAHCIGDGAVGMMLEAVARTRQAHVDRDRTRGHRIRHRIEHIEMSREADLPRFAAEEVVPSMQPFHQRPPTTLWHNLVPETHWGHAFPWRSLNDTGAPPVFGSDWPIVSCDCLRAIRHVASRQPWRPGLPDQGLSVEDAVAGFTSLPPRAVHREDRLGRLEPGMLADLVVLTPGCLPSDENARVQLTISHGRVVHRV